MAIWLAAAPALADDTVVIVSGTAPAHARDVASSAIARATDLAGAKIVPSPFLPYEEATLTRCLADKRPWDCMSPTLRSKSVQQLAMVSVDNQTAADGSPILAITEQVLTSAQFAPAGDKRFCDHCTDDVLARFTSELTRDLLRQVAARSGHTVLAIKTVPRGAQITLDGKLMNVTDQSINTYPGTHSLVLALDGYQVATRTVDIPDGKTTDVNVTLVKTPMPPGHKDGTTVAQVAPAAPVAEPTGIAAWPRWVPWAGIIGGGAAVVTGGVLIVIDNKPSSAPTSDHSPDYYSARRSGIVTAAIGGVALGAGLVLLYLQHNARSTIAAAPTRGGAALQWTTAF